MDADVSLNPMPFPNPSVMPFHVFPELTRTFRYSSEITSELKHPYWYSPCTLWDI